ncbi:hypothetical protein H696_01938 [Fonticula alba]|uniref:sphinganine-1-phosphate aldolase n=1 Tax=Fonticula alba TaxID=691883 RepID=A0A058ZC31_FONAL|nr:hypothetical protein H696_01938 [Fonticula alba]KCV70992.1 hypothetical protein H696_01938 [Fonticula alba]|eukprot:XP_009494115.1 hypothetical protein H696_01938 [Fonticula alba]
MPPFLGALINSGSMPPFMQSLLEAAHEAARSAAPHVVSGAIIARNVVAAGGLLHLLQSLYQDGLRGLTSQAIGAFFAIPGVQPLVRYIIRQNVGSTIKMLDKTSGEGGTADSGAQLYSIPEKGLPHEQVLAELADMLKTETESEEGRLFAYVYTDNDSERNEALRNAFHMACENQELRDESLRKFVALVFNQFAHTNALNPSAFPSLRRMETETVAMMASLMNGDSQVVGSMTSGGTESILLAIKAYRDRARDLSPHIKKPNMVLPITAHPAFEKAAHYFGVETVYVQFTDDFKADTAAMYSAINSNTILLVASAVQYCHGVCDPIAEIAAIAQSKGLPLHIDACFGGLMLPWVEKLGYPVPAFDFRVPGVTSISADLHKYGFALKGSSVLLFRNEQLRHYQYFAYPGWPGGLFGSPSIIGTRPGGNIATAWATLRVIGCDGYMETARRLMEVTQAMMAGVEATGHLRVLGKPEMTAFAFSSSDPSMNIFSVADAMERRGWKMERQSEPPSLHCSVMPNHIDSHQQFIADIAEAVKDVKEKRVAADGSTAAVYGMVMAVPSHAVINEFIVGFLSEMYKAR